MKTLTEKQLRRRLTTVEAQIGRRKDELKSLVVTRDAIRGTIKEVRTARNAERS